MIMTAMIVLSLPWTNEDKVIEVAQSTAPVCIEYCTDQEPKPWYYRPCKGGATWCPEIDRQEVQKHGN